MDKKTEQRYGRSKKSAKISSFIVKRPDGYFTAKLDSGQLRIGLIDCECFDTMPGYPAFDKVQDATSETVEELYDEFFGNYVEMCRKACLGI